MRNYFPFGKADADVVPAEGARRFESLARNLEVLASEPRLELLHALRTPRALAEIRVAAGMSREGETEGRPLTRQAVARHLDQLQEAGLLARERAKRGGRGEAYVLNHERLFALVDELRGLAKLRPILQEQVVPGKTLSRDDAAAPRLPPAPRLMMAYGRDDGVAFALSRTPGTRWRVGRAPSCDIRLDYDPFLSGDHCTIERTEQGFAMRDGGSRNGTWLNWERLPPGIPRGLASGDLLTVGRSVLVLQA